MYRKLTALVMFAIALSSCMAASFHPTGLDSSSGCVSTIDMSKLQTKDQTGTQDKWADYIEFYGTDPAYAGVFTFDVTGLDVNNVSSYSLNVNYKGAQKTEQVWQFEWMNYANGNWTFAGDNAAAPNWAWIEMAYPGTVSFASLVSNNTMQLRYSSPVAHDNSDIDFLELQVGSGSASTSAPTSAPTSAATDAPTTAPTEAPTDAPTEAPTSMPTQDPNNNHGHQPTHQPTEQPTHKPTHQPTEQPTHKPTEKPTEKPTHQPTEKPTHQPTEQPTQKPTTKPTHQPTEQPTQKPTSKPTSAPTTKPSTGKSSTTSASSGASGSGPNGKFCPAGTHYAPGPQTTWQWQLTGKIDTSVVAQMYDIDMFDSATTLIAELHSLGRAVTCYIDTAYEPGRPDSSDFTAAVLGNGIDGWPGQKWVDIRSSVVRNIMTNRIEMAASKGCDAVEMDDVDSYENNPGFPLTAADQADFNNFLATTAHANDLGIALKNDIDQVTQLEPNFDFAINEQCFQYDECTALNSFIQAGKAVFGVEYSLATSQFCSKANADEFSWLKKDLNLDASLTTCCTTCSGTYSCVADSATRSVPAEENFSAKAPLDAEYAAAGSSVSAFASIVVIALLVVLL